MVRTLLLIFIAGGLGSVSRYLVSFYLLQKFPSAFSVGTFSVNIIGCFLIGLFFGLSSRFQWFSDEWRIFLTVGFCGGFTTFSAFAMENVKLLQQGFYGSFFLYCVGSIVIGMLVFLGGMYLSK